MRRSTIPSNPFLLWTQLALKTGEMLVASGQVIPIRLGRMAAAGHQPSAGDQREFARMGLEKWEAGTESLLAVGVRLQAMQWQWMAQLWRPWTAARWQHHSADMARLGSLALAPIHAASTANARRLTQAKRRTGAALR